jgi:predicted CXXCH cytochrome family protein
MIRKWQGSVLLVLTVLLGLQGYAVAADGDGIRIVLPKNKTYITERYVTFIAAVDTGKIDKISLLVNKKNPLHIEVTQDAKKRLPDGMMNVCKILTLDEGENILTVTGYRQEKEVEKRSLRLFFAAKYSRDKSVPPSDYQAAPFHTATGEALCADCHKGLIQPARTTTVLSGSPCIQCHPYITANKFQHGPAAVGDCVSCHTFSDKNRYAIAKPLKNLCVTCHEEVMKSWEAMKYVHGPTATGDCAICHNPHSSDEKFFLRKKTNVLCIGCHEEKATGKHVIASFVFGNTHPVSGSRNPMKPDRAFSCASCHSPHASNTKEMFAFETRGGKFSICQTCHKK